MTTQPLPSEYLVLSRGHWDEDKSAEQIQQAIDAFYVWRDGLVAAGRMRGGQRLARQAKMVSRGGVTDGPFAEAKEYAAGFYVVDCETEERVIEIAAQTPDAESNDVEIWPVLDMSQWDW